MFQQLLDRVLHSLSTHESAECALEPGSIRRFESFAQVFVYKPSLPDVKMKIDFVNDLAGRYGSFEDNDKLGTIDGWQNILSNKLTALFRSEPKDVADLWIIAQNRKFSWRTIVMEAKNKEAGVEPGVLYTILKSFPVELLNSIKWTREPDYRQIRADLDRISEDIFYGRENSLKNS
jgi:hypothetical protein